MIIDISMVLFKSRPTELERTLQSISHIVDEFRHLWILLSGDDAEERLIRDEIKRFGLAAKAVMVARRDNLGFASGHNLLLRQSFGSGSDAVLVLNPDCLIESGAITDLKATAMGHDPDGIWGPSLRRINRDGVDESTIDSMGIAWSRSGRHYDVAQGNPWAIRRGRIHKTKGVSGACMLVPRTAFRSVVDGSGWFFDDAFLAYREDAELGVRSGYLGVQSWVVEMDGFAHVRSVRGYARGNALSDLLGVRNRFVMRSRLGRFRPGAPLASTLRDLLVFLACMTVERQSAAGFWSAWRIRRYLRLTSPLRTMIGSRDGS